VSQLLLYRIEDNGALSSGKRSQVIDGFWRVFDLVHETSNL